jgi:hypothetical protein
VRPLRPLHRTGQDRPVFQAKLQGIDDDWRPSWNIPPTGKILAVREEIDAGVIAITGSRRIGSATIITTNDGPDMYEIHNRMPVILEKDIWERWLDPELEDRDELEGMLQPSPAGDP